MERSRTYNAAVVFDETSKTPMFRYTNSAGQRREVWFENAASIAHKIDLVNKWDLNGFALWRIGMEDPAIWDVIKSKVSVEK